jgi:hypothetical protein
MTTNFPLAVKIPKGPIMHTPAFFIPRPSKTYPYWYQNKPYQFKPF